jgi:hypothetical protein
MAATIKPVRVGTVYVWRLPAGLDIMWAGPGSGLSIGAAFEPGARMSPIEHPSADGQYDSLRAASAAVDAFVNAPVPRPRNY